MDIHFSPRSRPPVAIPLRALSKIFWFRIEEKCGLEEFVFELSVSSEFWLIPSWRLRRSYCSKGTVCTRTGLTIYSRNASKRGTSVKSAFSHKLRTKKCCGRYATIQCGTTSEQTRVLMTFEDCSKTDCSGTKCGCYYVSLSSKFGVFKKDGLAYWEGTLENSPWRRFVHGMSNKCSQNCSRNS